MEAGHQSGHNSATSPKFAAGSPEDPAIFGPYLLYGLIARGGMAEVYRARRRGTSGDKMLAIKVMRPQLAREARFVDMFIREGKLAVMLTSDAIVRTYEVGEVEGRYFIAMEYIAGRDLTQVLRRCQEMGQRIPVPHAVAIAARICEGLHFAHTLTDGSGADTRALSIVNRDVSPSNVRLSYDGEVKLLDFGIAQAMLKFTSEIGILKGKFSYMSPEQIRGMPVDARTDVFSTGIILHEMLTTEKLFRGETEFALMEKVRNADVLPPSRFNKRVPEALDKICLRALARDVADRYPSAAELQADLITLLATYRFNPIELTDFVRGLFRQDFAREIEEARACTEVPGLAAANALADESIEPEMVIDGTVDGDDATPVPSSLPIPAPAQALPVRGEVRSTSAPIDTSNSLASPAREGLWARLKNKLSSK